MKSKFFVIIHSRIIQTMQITGFYDFLTIPYFSLENGILFENQYTISF